MAMFWLWLKTASRSTGDLTKSRVSPAHSHFLLSMAYCCSAAQLLNSLWPMNSSTPGLPVCHYLPEHTQTHAHWVSDAIQPSHLLLSPSPPAFNLSQHQGLFQLVSSSHQVVKVLELQFQHQSFQWISLPPLLWLVPPLVVANIHYIYIYIYI